MAWHGQQRPISKQRIRDLSFQQGQISCQQYILQILRSSPMNIFNPWMKENEWKGNKNDGYSSVN
jgi:hypothetical protein